MKKLLRRLRKNRAQGMTEYIIIVGLIAILLIGAVKIFKGQVESAFDESQKKVKSEVTDQIKGSGG